MKLSINGYEVEIKVKREGEKKANAAATKMLLNTLIEYSYMAYDQFRDDGHYGLAEGALKVGNDIYDALENEGFFK